MKINFFDVIFKVKARGLYWFSMRCLQELGRLPLPLLGRLFGGLYNLLHMPRMYVRGEENGVPLFLVWDLNIHPTNFNVLEYICLLEPKLKDYDCDYFEIVVVPEHEETAVFDYGYRSIVNREKRRWQFNNIAYPLMRMHPLCKSIRIGASRKEVYETVRGTRYLPEGWSPIFPKNFRFDNGCYRAIDGRSPFVGIEPDRQAMNYVLDRFIKKSDPGRIVTITIREQHYDVVRNSNKLAWCKFTNFLYERGYSPIIIPDTDAVDGCDEVFNKNLIYKDFAWNLYLRFALYRLSALNFASSNGPASMMIFSQGCNFLLMNYYLDGSEIHTKKALKKMGLRYGNQYEFSGENQRISFLADDYENIVHEFLSIEPTIDGNIAKDPLKNSSDYRT